MPKVSDAACFYTAHGASALAERIEAYWIKRGYPGIVAERFEIPGSFPKKYGVRSNIGQNGFPPSGPAVIDLAKPAPFVSALV